MGPRISRIKIFVYSIDYLGEASQYEDFCLQHRFVAKMLSPLRIVVFGSVSGGTRRTSSRQYVWCRGEASPPLQIQTKISILGCFAQTIFDINKNTSRMSSFMVLRKKYQCRGEAHPLLYRYKKNTYIGMLRPDFGIKINLYIACGVWRSCGYMGRFVYIAGLNDSCSFRRGGAPVPALVGMGQPRFDCPYLLHK